MRDNELWLSAPPPELEVVESVEVTTRWHLAAGEWVKEGFTPRISPAAPPKEKSPLTLNQPAIGEGRTSSIGG